MLKRIFLLLILFGFPIATPRSVSAQETIRIADLYISVWPEYDQPGVLVQYQGKVVETAESPLPREIAFLIPSGVGVTAACAVKSDGTHTSETWKEADADDGFTRVNYKLTEPQFHVEFYYNPLVGTTEKTMEFTYKAAVPADTLSLDIQHPLRATNFGLTPSETESHKDKEGFTYHTYNLKQIEVGQTVSTKVAYTKTDPSPSVSGQKSQSTTGQTPSVEGINPNLVVVLVVVVAALALVAFFVFVRRPQLQVATIASSRTIHELSHGGYCTECGFAMDADDSFCARCGTRRKALTSQ